LPMLAFDPSVFQAQSNSINSELIHRFMTYRFKHFPCELPECELGGISFSNL